MATSKVKVYAHTRTDISLNLLENYLKSNEIKCLSPRTNTSNLYHIYAEFTAYKLTPVRVK